MSIITSVILLLVGFALGWIWGKYKNVIILAREVGLKKIMDKYNIPKEKIYKEVKQ